MIDFKKISSIEALLAISILLEYESADRLNELAQTAQQHNEPLIADLLKKLAAFSEQHAMDIRELSEGRVLPDMATMGVSWEGLDGASDTLFEDRGSSLNGVQMIQIALRNETQAQNFYCQISLKSEDAEVRKMAAEFANEENEHVMLIQQWLEDNGMEVDDA